MVLKSLLLDKGYLQKLVDDPASVITLGDSAYHRSKEKEGLGMGRPVPLRKDGVQQKVKKNIFFRPLTLRLTVRGEEVSESHKVQSIRPIFEQTICRELRNEHYVGPNENICVSSRGSCLPVLNGGECEPFLCI